MRKLIWLAATAAVCLSSPALAGGKSASPSASQGKGNANGNGNGNANGNSNGQGNGNSNGQGNGGSGSTGSSQPGNSGNGSAGAGNGSIATAPVACGVHDISVAALACSGFYSGNLLSNASVAAQVTGLKAIGFDWNGDFTALDAGGWKFDANGATTLNFSQPLAGLTVLGIHFGGGGANGVGNGTAFYLFDAGSALAALGLNYPGSSGVVIYSTHAVTPVTPPPANPTPPSNPVPPVTPPGDNGLPATPPPGTLPGDPLTLPPVTLPGDTLPAGDPQAGAGAVPEPASWALMIGGFGVIGAAMRRRRTAARFA